jgi:hypothetical protein
MKKIFLFTLLSLTLGMMSSCENKDKEPTRNEENGHEWVDLGLSVKWATCNVGATKPEEFGDYFAWGETSPKTSYTKENYTYTETSNVLPLSADAANANWGGDWRLPTQAELEELLDKCTWTWCWNYNGNKGLYGYIVTSKINGKAIFLPSASLYIGDELDDFIEGYGAYMTSTYLGIDNLGRSVCTGLFFHELAFDWGPFDSYRGYPVRAVIAK